MSYFTTQDGCKLYYQTHGGDESSRPTIVFLNGTMQNTLHWKSQCDALHDRFRILTYDTRAQGLSDTGRQELSLAGHTADLADLFKHLGIEAAILVGLSHGSRVALAYAAKSSEQVDQLVLCSAGATLTSREKVFVRSWLDTLKGPGLEAMVWASLPVVFGESFLKKRERILEAMVAATAKRNSRKNLCAHLEAMTSYPELAQLAVNINVSTLVISASEDPLVTERGARELADKCNGEHRHLFGIGHSIPIEAPELFNEILLEFINRH